MNDKKYRNNVCAVIRRKPDNSVLVFHRKGFPSHEGWQFPQGGIDVQKDLISELKRELREEIGTDDILIITILPNTYVYDFPENIALKHKRYCGQRQRWVLVQLNGDERDINFNGKDVEFDDYQWVTAGRAISMIIDFKKDVYNKALRNFHLI